MTDVGDGATISTERGQAALIGFVILIGMVAVASAGILVVGGDLLTTTEHQTEEERVLQAFTELSQNMHTVSANDDVARSIDLDAGEHGAVVKTNTSTLHVSGGDADETIHIGAIEYEGDDGTRIAYQSGAVFHETGEETQIVSSPPVYFDADAESLSFPIIKAKDDADLSSGDITVRHAKTDPLEEANLVENDTVTIKITSEYYRGWEGYFEQQGGPTSVRDVEIYEENESGTVTAEFGYLDIDGAFGAGITTAENPEAQGGIDPDKIDGEVRAGSMLELDEMIERMVDEENTTENREWGEEPWVIDGSEDPDTFENGTYFADEVNLENEELDIDLTEGNVTLIVDGDVTVDSSEITVASEEGNALKIYTTGHFHLDGGHMCVDECPDSGDDADSQHIQLYGTSESHVGIGQGDSIFEGLIYVASNEDVEENAVIQQGQCSEYQVCMHSKVDFYGSLVGASAHLQGGGGSISFEYDPDLQDADIDIYPDGYALPPQLTYLNIAEHQVEIEEN